MYGEKGKDFENFFGNKNTMRFTCIKGIGRFSLVFEFYETSVFLSLPKKEPKRNKKCLKVCLVYDQTAKRIEQGVKLSKLYNLESKSIGELGFPSQKKYLNEMTKPQTRENLVNEYQNVLIKTLNNDRLSVGKKAMSLNLCLLIMTKYTFTANAKAEIMRIEKLSGFLKKDPELQHGVVVADSANLVNCPYDSDVSYLIISSISCGASLSKYKFKEEEDRLRNLRLAAYVIKSISKVMIYLHSKNFTHNDISVKNILVDDGLYGPVFKLIDFGSHDGVGNENIRVYNDVVALSFVYIVLMLKIFKRLDCLNDMKVKYEQLNNNQLKFSFDLSPVRGIIPDWLFKFCSKMMITGANARKDQPKMEDLSKLIDKFYPHGKFPIIVQDELEGLKEKQNRYKDFYEETMEEVDAILQENDEKKRKVKKLEFFDNIKKRTEKIYSPGDFSTQFQQKEDKEGRNSLGKRKRDFLSDENDDQKKRQKTKNT